jgi:hypothetical protein
MRNKKDSSSGIPDEQKVLEERVDAMMDPKRLEAAKPGASQAAPAEKDGLPPLDIFAGAKGAPELPGEVSKSKPLLDTPETEVAATEEVASQDIPAEIQIDDAASDAAVDDIVAHEGDTVLEVDDASSEQAVQAPQPKKKLHHHPVFWTLVTLVALTAIAAAVLLVSGGNWQLPGPLQSAKNALTK